MAHTPLRVLGIVLGPLSARGGSSGNVGMVPAPLRVLCIVWGFLDGWLMTVLEMLSLSLHLIPHAWVTKYAHYRVQVALMM